LPRGGCSAAVPIEDPKAREENVFNEEDPLVQLKLEILRRALPARDAVVFGDIYGVDGAYTAKCVEYGCERALLVDTHESAAWLRLRLEHPSVDFYKGDFADAFFMASVRETFEVGVAFDVLLHQAPLLHTLHLMLEKVTGRFLVCQPMLEEQPVPNTVVYLPGNTDTRLHPYPELPDDYRVLDVGQVNQSHWIWGMTPSFLRSALAGEGFEVVFEAARENLPPNERWSWRGYVAERRAGDRAHWSDHAKTMDLRVS
jgi:hypothetical protein